jgi:hypothetical protein
MTLVVGDVAEELGACDASALEEWTESERGVSLRSRIAGIDAGIKGEIVVEGGEAVRSTIEAPWVGELVVGSLEASNAPTDLVRFLGPRGVKLGRICRRLWAPGLATRNSGGSISVI